MIIKKASLLINTTTIFVIILAVILLVVFGAKVTEEDAYDMVLAVRGGQSPRPADALVAPGEKRVLLDLLREYGITDAEYALVQRANGLSDNLVALEVRAMNAVKGVFADGRGELVGIIKNKTDALKKEMENFSFE